LSDSLTTVSTLLAALAGPRTAILSPGLPFVDLYGPCDR